MLILCKFVLHFLDSISELDSVFFYLADSNVISFVSSFKASLYIHVIVFDDSQNDVRSRDTLRSLRGLEHSRFLDLCVDVCLTRTCVGRSSCAT